MILFSFKRQQSQRKCLTKKGTLATERGCIFCLQRLELYERRKEPREKKERKGKRKQKTKTETKGQTKGNRFGRKGSSSSGARGFALRSYDHPLQRGRRRGGDRETERVGSGARTDLWCAGVDPFQTEKQNCARTRLSVSLSRAAFVTTFEIMYKCLSLQYLLEWTDKESAGGKTPAKKNPSGTPLKKAKAI